MVASTRVIRVQAEFEHDSGLPADSITNTWHFHQDDVGTVPQDLPNIFDMVQDFYTVVPDGETGLIASLYSSQLNGNVNLTAWSLDDPLPRIPIGERTFVFTPGSTAAPSEVAYVVSFQGIQVSGESQAQRRGRLYLGPFGTDVIGADGQPTVILQDRVAAAARDLIQASNASVTNSWGVDSPTRRADVNLPDSFTPVVDGWADNAFDTQRSRGRAPSARLLFDATTPPEA